MVRVIAIALRPAVIPACRLEAKHQKMPLVQAYLLQTTVAGRRKFIHCQHGFTYLMVLIVIAIMGVTLALLGTVWHTEATREKEIELLFIGGEFRRAIKQYYQTGGQYPKRLEDMLKDPRQPNIARYLRKLYSDPVTGKKDWGLVRGPDGGIIAVHSISQDGPLKTAGFSIADKDFEGKTKYSEWQFVGTPTAYSGPRI